MASRMISTRIAIEGESEYKQALSNINSSLGALKSELSNVKAEFNGNANSMDALRAKGELLNKLQTAQAEKVKAASSALENARKAQAEYAAKVEECTAKVAQAEAALRKLDTAANPAAGAQTKLADTLEEYRKELAEAERYNEAAQRGVNSWQKQVNGAEKELKKLNADLQKNDQYMSEAKKSADGCAVSIDQYGKKVKEAGGRSQDSFQAVEALAAALMAGGLKVAFEQTTEAIRACIAASVEYESAIAGVYKTVDGSKAELGALSDGIRQMALEIPAATTEIAAVAEAAGQLEIQTGDILSFTRVMLDLGQSTNLGAAGGNCAERNLVRHSFRRGGRRNRRCAGYDRRRRNRGVCRCAQRGKSDLPAKGRRI